MKLSRSLLVLSSLAFIGAVAAASGACSSSPSVTVGTPNGLTILPSNVTYATWGLDATCTDGQFAVEQTNLGSCTGSIYILCDNGTWDDFSCDDPSGTSGWTPYTAAGTDGGPGIDAGDSGGPGVDGATDGQAADGGSPDAGPSTDGGSSDGGQGATGDAGADAA
jgi:hypothetical protein